MEKKVLDRIKRLSIDKNFGVLTRNALEEKIISLKRDYLFVDFCNLKKLNNLLGYKKVNVLIKGMLDEFNADNTFTIGRWFSGDEIIIFSKNTHIYTLDKLRVCGKKHNVSFKQKVFTGVKSLRELIRKIDGLKISDLKR